VRGQWEVGDRKKKDSRVFNAMIFSRVPLNVSLIILSP
jgi:hypothetical protein